MNKEVIMYNSYSAAWPETMKGWVSSRGRFFGNEHAARYDGCTHHACTVCGKPALKYRTYCDACNLSREIERYQKRESREWDGESMLFSEAHNMYFESVEQVEEWVEEPSTLDDLRLIICRPIYAYELEADYFSDALPDETDDIPTWLSAAIDAFNAALKDKPPLSWEPGPYRLKLR